MNYSKSDVTTKNMVQLKKKFFSWLHLQISVVSTAGVSFIAGWGGKANWLRIVWGGGGWMCFHL